MKITIDTAAKAITVEEAVSLTELTELVQRMFPNDHKEWKVIAPTKIQLAEVIREVKERSWPWAPPIQPYWEMKELPQPHIITC